MNREVIPVFMDQVDHPRKTNPFAALASDSSDEEPEEEDKAPPAKRPACAAKHQTAPSSSQAKPALSGHAGQLSVALARPFDTPMPPNPAAGKASFDQTEAGFTQRDLATCIHVLKQLSREENHWALFKSKEFRGLRVALDPVVKEQMKKYDLKSVAGRKRQREERKEAKSDLDLMDREFTNRSLLRAKRLQKLEELNAQGGPTDAAPPSAAATLMLTDSGPNGALAVAGAGSAVDGDGEGASIPRDGLRVPDGVSVLTATEAARAEADMLSGRDRRVLSAAANCYTCKRPYVLLHFFYDQLCPDCAALNYFKREQRVNMAGKWCLVTGARVKIGFHCCLKLLRCGANVVATSRFPTDCSAR